MNAKYGSKGWMFMQDGASVHTADLHPMTNFMEDWPSGSPDLNPIESVWVMLKRRVEEICPDSIEMLMDFITQTWNGVKLRIADNRFNSMSRRPTQVVQKQGN
jgi:transposase